MQIDKVGVEMPRISVLMSVYNEDEQDFTLAVNSVLNQTYRDFELIIVCDNPSNSAMIAMLQRIEKQDSRIKIVMNEKNMGLALSMNHGFEYAEGDIIARIDADDISFPDRFEKQIDCLTRNNYDLVWSSYVFIDEKGIEQDIAVQYYNDEEVPKTLPLKNIVHHPTVMMRREAFENAGLYRNYPCAQDYDLWLRMLYCGSRLHMMPDKLLLYRVRSTSTTSRKKYQQLCTLNYIRKLYKERQKNGSDSYSYDNYCQAMKSEGVGDSKTEKSFLYANALIGSAKKQKKNGQYFSAIAGYLKAMFVSKAYRHQLSLMIERKLGR